MHVHIANLLGMQKNKKLDTTLGVIRMLDEVLKEILICTTSMIFAVEWHHRQNNMKLQGVEISFIGRSLTRHLQLLYTGEGNFTFSAQWCGEFRYQ